MSDVAAGTVRFVDSQGIAWEVREVLGANVPAARGPRCLLFVSTVACRRVWNVPDRWQAFSPVDLERLSWHT